MDASSPLMRSHSIGHEDVQAGLAGMSLRSKDWPIDAFQRKASVYGREGSYSDVEVIEDLDPIESIGNDVTSTSL